MSENHLHWYPKMTLFQNVSNKFCYLKENYLQIFLGFSQEVYFSTFSANWFCKIWMPLLPLYHQNCAKSTPYYIQEE